MTNILIPVYAASALFKALKVHFITDKFHFINICSYEYAHTVEIQAVIKFKFWLFD